MKILKILLITVPLLFLISACSNSISNNNISKVSSTIAIENNNQNLWDIPMTKGKIEISFKFTNTWNENVKLLEWSTSCMCTEATVKWSNGILSSRIKMPWHWAIAMVNQTLKPWESAQLIATFDPNAHWPNWAWPISRDVFIKTNSTINPELRFNFKGIVIKKELKPVEPQIKFSEQNFDFWLIKQSWWKVKHDFKFTYLWDKAIEITWVPTSCACTTASINKTHFNPWDEWILTVKFNPNLHAEPEWKFFKTVSLLTEPDLKNIPEVKIWTEIDLDLWPQAFELKSDHVESDKDHDEVEYHSITPETFDWMLHNKDFVLIDTHIPEQEHIKWTDLFIPYNEYEKYEIKLPKNKNAKIVIYCRSWSMSRAFAYQMIEHWYTNVYDLVWGRNAYVDFLKTHNN